MVWRTETVTVNTWKLTKKKRHFTGQKISKNDVASYGGRQQRDEASGNKTGAKKTVHVPQTISKERSKDGTQRRGRTGGTIKFTRGGEDRRQEKSCCQGAQKKKKK